MTQPKQSPVALIWSAELGQEPTVSQEASLQPQRLLQAYQFMESVALLSADELYLLAPDESLGTFERLTEFHEADYCDIVGRFDDQFLNVEDYQRFGFYQDSTIPFEGMKEVATGFVAAARTAVQLTTKGERTKVMSLAGEQYHAQAGRAEAGHIFNDVLLALLDARATGQKVAFINLEAEHPKVIQDYFFNDSSVLTISLHESADFLYPGTGDVAKIGQGEGHGFNINVPMPPGAGDVHFLHAFEDVALPVLERFNAQIVLLLAGSSAHVDEPLAHLRLTSYGYQQLVKKVMSFPHLVLLGGGGTDWALTARLWTLALATLAEQALSKAPFLHDKPLPRLPITMQNYTNRLVKKKLTKAKELLFPLWELAIIADIAEEAPSSSPSEALPDYSSGYQTKTRSQDTSAKGEATLPDESSLSASQRQSSKHSTDERAKDEKKQQSGAKKRTTSQENNQRSQQFKKRTSRTRKRRRSPRKKSSPKSKKEK